MSNRARYFRHDCNARNDDKLTELRIEHGPAGYGVYFMLLERLRDEENYRGQLTDRYIKALAYDFHADAALIRSTITDFGLFQVDEEAGTFGSDRFEADMRSMEQLSQKRQEAAAQRWNPGTGANSDMPNRANECQSTPQNANAQETHANAQENNANADVLHTPKFPPYTPPITEYNITENNISSSQEEEMKEEPFRMPDERPEAQALKTRLQAVEWPDSFTEEFMRLADYGTDPQSPALRYLALYEQDRMKYEPTKNTPTNIMAWLKNQEQKGTLQPKTTIRILNFMRTLKRQKLHDGIKNRLLHWVQEPATQPERENRIDALLAAIKDIGKGKINSPEAFLIATMKKA